MQTDVERKIDRLLGALPARSKGPESPLVKLRALFSELNKKNGSQWMRK